MVFWPSVNVISVHSQDIMIKRITCSKSILGDRSQRTVIQQHPPPPLGCSPRLLEEDAKGTPHLILVGTDSSQKKPYLHKCLKNKKFDHLRSRESIAGK